MSESNLPRRDQGNLSTKEQLFVGYQFRTLDVEGVEIFVASNDLACADGANGI